LIPRIIYFVQLVQRTWAAEHGASALSVTAMVVTGSPCTQHPSSGISPDPRSESSGHIPSPRGSGYAARGYPSDLHARRWPHVSLASGRASRRAVRHMESMDGMAPATDKAVAALPPLGVEGRNKTPARPPLSSSPSSAHASPT
jgi:hypothetical protein